MKIKTWRTIYVVLQDLHFKEGNEIYFFSSKILHLVYILCHRDYTNVQETDTKNTQT